jgi:hypothetical protein
MGHRQSWIIEFSFHNVMFKQSVNADVHIVLFSQDARILEMINNSHRKFQSIHGFIHVVITDPSFCCKSGAFQPI